jgi:hypothetical protein
VTRERECMSHFPPHYSLFVLPIAVVHIYQGMLSISAEKSIVKSSLAFSRTSHYPNPIRAKTIIRTRTAHRTLHSEPPLSRQASTGTCASCTRPPSVFAYLSRRRNNRPVISLAMSGLSRRNVTTPSSSSSTSKRPAGTSDHDHADHSGHTHSHSHDGHDHDHSHGGIFHSHAHDHGEGAQQIIQAFSQGKLDRGTRITLLGKLDLLLPQSGT